LHCTDLLKANRDAPGTEASDFQEFSPEGLRTSNSADQREHLAEPYDWIGLNGDFITVSLEAPKV